MESSCNPFDSMDIQKCLEKAMWWNMEHSLHSTHLTIYNVDFLSHICMGPTVTRLYVLTFSNHFLYSMFLLLRGQKEQKPTDRTMVNTSKCSFPLVFNFSASPIQTLYNLIQFKATQFQKKEQSSVELQWPGLQKIRIIGHFFENRLHRQSEFTIYSMYLHLNLSTTPDLKFYKP